MPRLADVPRPGVTARRGAKLRRQVLCVDPLHLLDPIHSGSPPTRRRGGRGTRPLNKGHRLRFPPSGIAPNSAEAMKRGPPPPIDGLSWPVTGTDEEGKEQRSTQTTGKEILAAALGAVDETAADAVRNERGWRFKYRKHFVKSVEVSARSPDAALKVAAAGLDYMYDKYAAAAAQPSRAAIAAPSASAPPASPPPSVRQAHAPHPHCAACRLLLHRLRQGLQAQAVQVRAGGSLQRDHPQGGLAPQADRQVGAAGRVRAVVRRGHLPGGERRALARPVRPVLCPSRRWGGDGSVSGATRRQGLARALWAEARESGQWVGRSLLSYGHLGAGIGSGGGTGKEDGEGCTMGTDDLMRSWTKRVT
eukprot:scaffold3644_cov107-Isochrysis_galbana.AAC.11